MPRSVNQAGLDLIKAFEGLKLKAYQDVIGIWTIGYGHVSKDIKKGDTITAHQAEAILSVDLDKFERGVEELVPGLSENRFAACVSLAFNIGLGAFGKSTLRKKLLKQDWSGAADEFLKWRMAGGKVFPGLFRRRVAERALFLLDK